MYDVLPFPAGLEVFGAETESESSALVNFAFGIGYVVGTTAPSKLILSVKGEGVEEAEKNYH